MKIHRIKNTIMGTVWGSVQKIISIIFPFIIRTVFIKTLGVNYLGLNSLFASILQVLNLTELGISSALVFSMYKPIVEDDIDKICALMNLYKICYRIIGLVILGAGILLVPLIPYFIKGAIPPDINIYVLYFMNLGATVLSYWLFAYRNSLFNAHQRMDVISIITSIINLVTYVLQIVCLLNFHNYYLYLSVNILSQIMLNVVTAIVSKKFYPKYSAKGYVEREERKEIFKKVRDLFSAKIGGVINHSADSIVISSFLGIQILAVYQNYYYIVSTLLAFFMVFYNACDAGIANSLIVKNTDDNRKLLYYINHFSFSVLNFCFSALICLYQPFMEMWVGKQYLLDYSMVILFAVYLIAEVAPRTLVTFKDAGGIWRSDRFRPLIVATVNLIINIILVNIVGIKGVLISTIFSLLVVGYPWLIFNINHNLFYINIKQYLLRLLEYMIIICLCSVCTYQICKVINGQNLLLICFIRMVICCLVSNVLFYIFFRKTNENIYLMSIYKRILKKCVGLLNDKN